MKKIMMTIVCLMTMVGSVNAQETLYSYAYVLKEELVCNKINSVLHDEHIYHKEHIKHCDKGEFNNECDRCILAKKYHESRRNCRLYYGSGVPPCPICEYRMEEFKKKYGSYHSNKYGHYHHTFGGATLIGCSLCDNERLSLDYKHYEKLKRQRYKNWKRTDEYKLRRERERKIKFNSKKTNEEHMDKLMELFLSE